MEYLNQSMADPEIEPSPDKAHGSSISLSMTDLSG
jgi:hypothetical protein